MSANNWRVCPQCKKNWLNELKTVEQRCGKELSEAYGKVPAKDYMDLCQVMDARINSVEGVPPGETLREDYEIYTDEHGGFYSGYWSSCTTCGYKFENVTRIDTFTGKPII